MNGNAFKLIGHILGKAAWLLLVIVCVEVIVIFLSLPWILTTADLSVPANWASVTFIVVRLTISVWVGTFLTSVARVVVWLRFKLAITKAEEWQGEKSDVQAIHSLSLWLLGLLTVLAAYLTQWFTPK